MSWNRYKGFTLIEIILVIILIAVVLAMALPNFIPGYGHFRLRQIAEDVVNSARWAQAMAMGQRCIYVLSFSDDRRSYGIMRVSGDEDGKRYTFEPVKGLAGRPHTVPVDIHLNTHQSYIQFYPDGTIDPATIELISVGRTVVLSSAIMRGVLMVVDDEEK